MTIVGIDYSKNSPAACIRNDNGLRFLAFPRGEDRTENEKKKDKGTVQYRGVKASGVEFNFHNSRSPQMKVIGYSLMEAWKINDAMELAKLVVSQLPEEVDMVGIEGFSYGARGNAVLDMAGYGYCIRAELVRKYGHEKLCIFAPSAVKKTAGKGNAGKPQMMEYFLESDDSTLKSTPFWKGLVTEENFNRTLKPVDDLVDAYWVQECTQNYHVNMISEKLNITE